ncbi:MAG: LTA synthase family protein [Blautia sp.]
MNKIKRIVSYGLPLLVLGLLVKDFRIFWGADQKPYYKWIWIALVLLMGVAAGFVILMTKKKNQFSSLHVLGSILLFLLLSAECQTLLELPFSLYFFRMAPSFLAINFILTGVLLGIFLFLLNSLRWTAVAGNIVFGVWGIANYFVTEFRGQPIQILDLISVATAAEVVGEYRFYLTIPMFCTIGAAVSAIVFFLWIPDWKPFSSRTGKVFSRILSAALFGCLVMFVLYAPYLNQISVNFWDQTSFYKTYGTQLTTYVYAQKTKIEKPKGYSVDTVEKILEKIPDSERESQVKPDIIAVMNESFADFSFMADFSTNEPFLPFFHSLGENCVKGKIYVSAYGAGTSRTEYEFLTGNSMSYFDTLVTPYMSYFKKKQYSLVSTLEAQGYTTCALHPANGKNWNRNNAYESMGFDRFLTYEDFQDAETERGWVTDRACYEKMLDLLDNKGEGERLFLFNVTMQNHGGYDVEDYEADTVIEGNPFENANQFISLVNESDKALQELISNLEQKEEPVILVFFGDHWPQLGGDFYKWLNGKSDSELDMETYQQYYMTPFVIWANYDIEAASDLVTSANYLGSMMLSMTGLEMPVYNNYLLRLQEQLPALSRYGYVAADGSYHAYEDMNEEERETFEEYRMVQYNNLFEKKRIDSVFSVNPTH